MSNENPSLHAALIAARASIPPIPKTADNPFYSSKYAPLDAIQKAIAGPVRDNGLSLTDFPRFNPEAKGYELVTLAVHLPSGESIEAAFPLPAGNPQAVGASMTYGRRYNRVALLDLDTEPDNDGNETAQTRATSTVNRSNPPQGTVSPVGTSPKPGACPKCGKKEFIKQLKTGKDAGRFRCMDWAEKKMYGCGATYNSDPRLAPKQADDFLAPVRQPAQQVPVPDDDGPPPPGDDDLPF